MLVDRSGQRLLAVHAHPDDESSKGAATLARYAAEGAEVLVATMTGGERGDVLNPALDRPEVRADLSRRRRAEMDRAREILGVSQEFLGFVDSGLPANGEALPEGCFAREPTGEAAAALVALIRRFRPQVVVTYDPSGGYPHPDHVKVHEVSVAAFAAAGDPAAYPGSGEPWTPSKLYYTCAFSKVYFQAIYDGMTAAGRDSPHDEVLREWDDAMPVWPITTRVGCADWFPVRLAAILAHETQVDPHGPERSCPVEIEQECWPTEDYHLAQSLVDTAPAEDDLFAGLTVRG
ncbi:mycothiol conjugate amidase Mca [Amycolatopsis sp. PS_44_ISF1]|uniref:mycothiol conjugate amidase Mca n=1 Tax=Amycolatopsis sp. PS_44_ISF1 TaxID=2974917 RepID=UPI0028E0084B|nr:mycothiol conjugate amidase Mca [Amycolatopsis sp. PS_44_ISF1]MDT8913098.1 mycothiol conjugate amidase Mca [Amycolatopsis sp. PS_44_ISF1]